MDGDQQAARGRQRILADELLELREQLYRGGGARRVERQHSKGKLTARERVRLLFDEGEDWFEIGLLLGYDLYEGGAPSAGVVTGVGRVHGRPVVVVANDATVKAGSWWPETITKMLRAQEAAMGCGLPIVYLVDSAGVNLPYQSGVFPGRYGAARIFRNCSIMRRWLRIPQIAAVMGPCIAGGAYLPALSDLIIMVEGSSFMGLGGPNLVKGATGRNVDAEELGGARLHVEISGVAHRTAPDDETCVEEIRDQLKAVASAPAPDATKATASAVRPAADLYELLPDDHRHPYDAREALACIVDANSLRQFQEGHAPELICARATVAGRRVGVLANARGIFPRPGGDGPPTLGGIIYTESARKAARFIDIMDRQSIPLLFIQDVSGFMVGPEAERSGIIRAGADFVEAMATAKVPRIVVTLNHASGAGYYAMAGQGFDPDFILSLPGGRMGVMEGASAVAALFDSQLARLREREELPDEELTTRMDEVRAEYDRQLDARFAAARGFVDAIVLPEELRPYLALLLDATRGKRERRTPEELGIRYLGADGFGGDGGFGEGGFGGDRELDEVHDSDGGGRA